MDEKPFISSALALFVLAACGEEPSRWSPEIEHCAVIAGRATEELNTITVVKVKVQDLVDTRTVQLRFEYPAGGEGAPVGNIICVYDVKMRTEGARAVKAQAVHFKGRYLSENELNFLNSSPFRALPEFKIKS
ncbi:hypothetical protein ACFL12_01555 [Pseudomonadota bacterium]